MGGSRPGWADSGLWNNTVTGPNAVLLGGDMSLLGLRVTNPGGPVTIGGAYTLTTSFAGTGVLHVLHDNSGTLILLR